MAPKNTVPLQKLKKKEINNFFLNEDFRYMKIHIFALRWKDEIERSSQLRNTTETSSG